MAVARARAPTGSRSSGAGSSPPRASSRWPRSTTTGAMCARVPRARHRPRWSRFHHFTIPRWLAAPGRVGGARRARALRPVRASGSPPTSATSSAGPARSTSPTSWPSWGISSGSSRPGCATRAGATPSTTRWCRAHRLGVEALRAGPGRLPGGPHPVHDRLSARARGRGAARADPAAHRGRVPRGHRRATTSSACSATPGCGSGPTGSSAAEEGVPTTQMGYEFWPEALEATVRRAWEVTGGMPGARHRERDRHGRRRRQRIAYVTGALAGRRGAASTTASTCGATSTGACSTTSSGSSGTGRPSAWSRWTTPPSSAGPSRARTGSATSPGPTPCPEQRASPAGPAG